MKKYLALYMAPVGFYDEMMKKMTPENAQKGMDNWLAWGEKHKKDIVDFGAPAGKNKRVTQSGIADVRNEVTGYSVVQAASHDAAAALFTDSPHLEHAEVYVDIAELIDMSQ